MKGKIIGLMCIVVFSLLIVSIFYYQSATAKNQTIIKNANLSDIGDIKKSFSLYYQPDRNSYGNGSIAQDTYDNNCLFENRRDPNKLTKCKTGENVYNFPIKDVFANLPEIPDDFYWIKYKMMDEGFVDVCSLPEAYWKQPEFMANTFTDSGLRYWQAGSTKYWYPEGYGTFPAVQWYDKVKGGDEFDICFLFYTSFGVSTQQGFQLIPLYLKDVYSPTEGIYYNAVEPSITQKHIQIQADPDVFVTEETYPLFNKEWVKKIKLHVKVADDTPTGNYAIGLNPVNPPTKKVEELSNKYPLYMTISGVTQNFPQFQALLTINVV